MVTDNASPAVPRTNGTGVQPAKTPLSVTISLAQKVGLPGYGNAECFLSINNVTAETSPEEMEAMLDQAGLGWSKIAARIRAKVAEIKQESGI